MAEDYAWQTVLDSESATPTRGRGAVAILDDPDPADSRPPVNYAVTECTVAVPARPGTHLAHRPRPVPARRPEQRPSRPAPTARTVTPGVSLHSAELHSRSTPGDRRTLITLLALTLLVVAVLYAEVLMLRHGW